MLCGGKRLHGGAGDVSPRTEHGECVPDQQGRSALQGTLATVEVGWRLDRKVGAWRLDGRGAGTGEEAPGRSRPEKVVAWTTVVPERLGGAQC